MRNPRCTFTTLPFDEFSSVRGVSFKYLFHLTWESGFMEDWVCAIWLVHDYIWCHGVPPYLSIQAFRFGTALYYGVMWCARCSVHTICCVRFCFSKTRVTSGVAWSREKYGLSFLWRSCPLFYLNSMWSLDSLQPLPRIYLVSLRKASVEPRSLYSWGCDGRHREKTARACDWSHKHMLHAASRQPHSHKHKHRDSDGSPQHHTGCRDWAPIFQFWICTLCDTLCNELWTGRVFCLNVFYWLP